MKSSGFKMKGWSGNQSSPAKQKDESFDNAFARARKEQGPGGTFTWKGNKYTTDRADDPKKDWSGKTREGMGELKPGYPKMVDGKWVHKYFQK